MSRGKPGSTLRTVGRAVVVSALIHGSLGSGLWVASSGGWTARSRVLDVAPTALATVDLPMRRAPQPSERLASDVTGPRPAPLPFTLVAADGARWTSHPTAPTNAPNPDPRAGAAAASSGNGLGVVDPTVALTNRRDRESLRAQGFNSDEGYQLNRIRTDTQRRSREEVRATPNPGWTPDLASLPGKGVSRVIPGAARRGAGGDRQVVQPLGQTGPTRPPSGGALDGGPRIGKDGDEAVGFQRPLLQRDPASTESERRSDDVADDRNQAAVSSERRPGPLELSHPSFIGRGDAGRGRGERPAWAPRGAGDEAVPAGDPSAARGRELELATYRRRYNQYLAEVMRRIDPLWEFPRDLAVKLEQGEVVLGFTIRRDGSVKDLRVVKSSGFKSFDANVLSAVRHAAPFPPLPPTFGPELRVQNAAFEGANPLIR